MTINKSNWLQDYKNGTAANSDKLVRNYTQATGKLAAATSDAAQKNFEDAMKDPRVLARRNAELKKLTEADLNKGMEATGASAYREGTTNNAEKALSRVGPYLDEIDTIKTSLKPRTRDAAQNVNNRVLPLATGLAAKKARGG